MPAVSQQRDLQVNSNNLQLISRSSSAQHIKTKWSPTNSALPTSLPQAPTSERAGWGGISNGQKWTLTGWHHLSKQPGDSVNPYPPGASSLHTEVTLRLEDISIPIALMLQVIPELPPFRKLQFHTRQPWQQIISDLHQQLRNLIFFHIHNK